MQGGGRGAGDPSHPAERVAETDAGKVADGLFRIGDGDRRVAVWWRDVGVQRVKTHGLPKLGAVETAHQRLAERVTPRLLDIAVGILDGRRQKGPVIHVEAAGGATVGQRHRGGQASCTRRR
jgi:hypothetical protein